MNNISMIVISILVGVQSLLVVSHLNSTDQDRSLSKHSTPFRSLKHGNNIYGSGSYIIWKNKPYILTNRHICLAAQRYNNSINVVQVDNSVARIIKIGMDGDLCLLESDRKTGLRISKSPASPLDPITLIGYPRGIGKVIRVGRIIGDVNITMQRSKTVTDSKGAEKLIAYYASIPSTQISALAYGGNSGSPVLNSNGLIIGVLFAGSPAYPNEPFIVPHKKLLKFLKSINNEDVEATSTSNKELSEEEVKNLKPHDIIEELIQTIPRSN